MTDLRANVCEVQTPKGGAFARLFAIPVLYPDTDERTSLPPLQDHLAVQLAATLAGSRYFGAGKHRVVVIGAFCGPDDVAHAHPYAAEIAACAVRAAQLLDDDDNEIPVPSVEDVLRLPDGPYARPPLGFLVGVAFGQNRDDLAQPDVALWHADQTSSKVQFLLEDEAAKPGQPSLIVQPPADLKDALVGALKYLIDRAVDGAGEPSAPRAEVELEGNHDVGLRIRGMDHDLRYDLSEEVLGRDVIEELINYAAKRICERSSPQAWTVHEVLH